jgi:hypothetical protein
VGIAVPGGSLLPGYPCYSDAYAYAYNANPYIYYDQSDYQSLCPVPVPPSVTINGTPFESFTRTVCRSRTWTTTVTAGTAPYTYRWTRNGSVVSTGSSYAGSVCWNQLSFSLAVTVTDALGFSGSDDHYVEVEYIPLCEPGIKC